jgi:hypothetical protein
MRERVDVVITEVRACVNEHVRVGIRVDDVAATGEGRIIRTRAVRFFDLFLSFRVEIVVRAGVV